MTDSKELEGLYLDLNKALKNGDHDKVLKASNKILHYFPQEKTAFHCKIVSLILSEKYEETLKQLKSIPQWAKELVFEKAYCEYRLKRNSDALATIEEGNKADLRLMELQAQVYFREEDFDAAYNKYRTILKDCKDDYEEERRANMSAVIASMRMFLGKDVGPYKVPESTYEIKYNSACYSIGCGDYQRAAQTLIEAEDLLRKTLESDPDITAQEINEELAPIKVQMGYVHHRLGEIQKANDIYLSIIKQRPDDVASLAVAANNIVCINRDQNIFDSRKRIKVATAEGAQTKLTSVQRHKMSVNEALFYHYTNQSEACRTKALQLIDNVASSIQNKQYLTAVISDLTPILIYVAQLIKERQMGKAVTYLEEKLGEVNEEKDERRVIQLSLTLAQLHLLIGSVSKCCEILSSARLPDSIRYSLGITSALITLYRHLENIEAANMCLRECLKYSREEQQPNVASSTSRFLNLLSTAAKLFMRHGDPQEAAKLYEEGLKMKPNDTGLLAHLIHAYSQFDKAQAEKMSKHLQSGDMLTDVEVDNLESAFLFGAKYTKRMGRAGESTNSPRVGRTPPDSGKSDGATAAVPEKKKNHKKKRKKILPKNYDPNIIPDPERWLPRRERSYYRPRRKDKRNPMRGPQGQTTGGADLDASSQPVPSQASPRPGVPSTPVSGQTVASSKPVSGAPMAKNRNKPGGGRKRR